MSAIESLGRIGDPGAADRLSAIIVQGVPYTKIVAIEALGEMGDTSSIPILFRPLQDREANIRWVSAIALGQLGHSRAITKLVGCLQDQEDSVREAATFALDQIDPDWRHLDITKAIVRSLGKTLLTDTITGNARFLHRYNVLNALSIADSVWTQTEWGTEIVGHYLLKLADPDPLVRRAAAMALGSIGDVRASSPLFEASRDTSTHVQKKALNALRTVGHPALQDRGLEILANGEIWAWTNAADVLDETADPKVVRYLARAIIKGDPPGMAAACRAMGRIGVRPVPQELYNALKNRFVFVRAAAVDALRELGDSTAVPYLEDVLREESVDPPRVIRAIERIEPTWGDSPTALDFAATTAAKLESGERDDRIAAGRIISNVRNEVARAALEEAVNRRNLPAVAGATPLLVRSADVRIDRALIDALNAYGTQSRASLLLQSGRPALIKAARTWARRHGKLLLSWPVEPAKR